MALEDDITPPPPPPPPPVAALFGLLKMGEKGREEGVGRLLCVCGRKEGERREGAREEGGRERGWREGGRREGGKERGGNKEEKDVILGHWIISQNC